MSTVINTNIAAIRTHNTYNRNNDYMNAAMTKVATGLKINTAKDNASTWAISERMRERIRANDQANQNVQTDSALVKTAQGGIGNTIDVLKTLKERLINAANDSNTNTDRSTISTEIQQLVDQIDDNVAKVKFNGRFLLDGKGTDETKFVSAYGNSGVTAVDDSADTSATTKTYATDADDDYSTSATEETEYAGITTDGLNDDTAKADHAILQIDMSGLDSGVNSGSNLNALKTDGGSAAWGIANNDKITFSWTNADGTDGKYEYSVTNAASETWASVVSAFNTSGSAAANAGLYMGSWTSAAGAINYDASNAVKEGGSTDSVQGVANAVYITSTSDVKNFKITIDGKDDANAYFEDKLSAYRSLYRADGVSSSSATTEGTRAVLGTADGAFTIQDPNDASKLTSTLTDGGSTALTDLKYDNAGTQPALFAANDTLKFSWVEEDDEGVKSEKSVTLKVVDAGSGDIDNGVVSTLDELSQAFTKLANADATGSDSGLRLRFFNEGDTITRGDTEVTDSSGNPVTAANSGFYMTAADGKNISGLLVTSSSSDSDTKAAVETAFTFDPRLKYNEPAQTDTGTPLTFHIGGEASLAINVTFKAMDSEALGIKDLAAQVGSAKEARAALSVVNNALDYALNEQTKLGSIESRLGYASDNLTTMNENLEAADSIMRDSDIAKEMTNYMKYSVLAQASQYMLAQSSQNAFSVLNLLQA